LSEVGGDGFFNFQFKMTLLKQEIKIFAAYTSGVENELSSIQKRIDVLNTTHSDDGVTIKLYNFDNLPYIAPSEDGLQKNIDPYITDCDIFIGILGVNPGSGNFEHELELGFQQTLANRSSFILFVFVNDVKVANNNQEGEPSYRNTLIEKYKQNAKYVPYNSQEKFNEEIDKSLGYIVNNICRKLALPQDREMMTKKEPEKAQDNKNITKKIPKRTELNGNSTILSSVIKRVGKFSENKLESISNFDRVRISLYSSALLYNKLLSSEILDNHELHIAYKFRDKMKLYFEESWLILETIISDDNDQKAGWYWFQKLTKKSLIDFARKYFINSNNDKIKIGAIILLDNFWSNKYLSILEKLASDESNSVRSKVLDILKKHLDKNSFKIISILKKDKESYICKSARELEIRLLIRFNYRRVLSLIKQISKADNLYISDFQVLLNKLSNQELTDLLDIKDESLVVSVYRELLKRKAFGDTKLQEFLQNKCWEIRLYTLNALITQGKKYSPEKVEKILQIDEKENTYFRLTRRSTDLNKRDILEKIYNKFSTEELEKSIEWLSLDGPLIYEIIGLRTFQNNKKEIRSDLQEGFKSKKDIWSKQLALKYKIPEATLQETYAKYEGFLIDQFKIAALKVILKYGNSKDVPIVKTLLNSDSYEIKKLCVKIIETYGSQRDSLILLDFALTASINDDTAIMGSLLLDKNGKYKIIEKIFDSQKYALMKKAIAFSLKFKRPIPPKIVSSLLFCDDDEVRVYAVALINKIQTIKENQELLKKYTTKESYYYNVVCWLDRILYAPSPLRKKFEETLQTILDKEIN